MDPFTQLTASGAVLDMINIDTDIIMPKQFLKTVLRTGLGKYAFYDLRYSGKGQLNPEFPLNNPAYQGAEILIAGDNFGCGSSREHAPWGLKDMGFRAFIAPSFADIFYNNCCKNGLLPIALPEATVKMLMRSIEAEPSTPIIINLEACTVSAEAIGTVTFTMDDFRRECLINGWDDISLTMQQEVDITNYEADLSSRRGWI